MLAPELCQNITAALENAKAKDVLLLDVSSLTDTTDCMLICTGTSGRHVASIARTIQDDLSAQDILPLGSEGADAMEWILLDYVHVVVHVMRSESRAYYDLESLWDARLSKVPAAEVTA